MSSYTSQVVTTSISSRPGESSCHPRLVRSSSIRSRPGESSCHPRLVPGGNY